MIVIDADRSPVGPFDRASGNWSEIDADGPIENYAVLRGPC